MRFALLISLLMSIIGLPTNAQPLDEWFRMYDTSSDDRFTDVYTVADEGFIMCGSNRVNDGILPAMRAFWVVRVGDDGDEIWSRSYVNGNPDDLAYSIIEADNGDFVIAGKIDGSRGVMRIDEDGELIWQQTYGGRHCNAIIELKSGEFLLTGRAPQLNQGYALCIDADGEELWDRIYDAGETITQLYTIREIEGGAVLAGRTATNGTVFVWAIKIDLENEGEVIWDETYSLDDWNCCYSMVSDGEGNLMLAVRVSDGRDAGGNSEDFSLLKIDGDGNQQWWRRYRPEDNSAEKVKAISKLAMGGYALVGTWLEDRTFRPIVFCVNENGTVRWNRKFYFREEDGFRIGRSAPNGFTSVVIGHDNLIYAGGYAFFDRDSTGRNGFLMVLDPDWDMPRFISYTPEDTMMTLLQGDDVQFIVYAFHPQGNELTYLWITDEDTLGNDTTETITFDELGEYLVQCQVSDGEFMATIGWRVTAEEFYLDSYTPDSLTLIIRRNTEETFSFDVRAMDGLVPEYAWTLTDREHRPNDIGNEPVVTYNFDLAGNFSLEGVVFRDQVEHSVR